MKPSAPGWAGLLLLLWSGAASAVDPSCNTSWSKTSTVWTCTGNGLIEFDADSSFVPATSLTLIAANGFKSRNNTIGSATVRVNLQSSYGDFEVRDSRVFGDMSSSSGVFDLRSSTINGFISTGGNISLQTSTVTGTVTSSNNTITASNSRLQNGLSARSGITLSGGSVQGAVVMTARNIVRLTGVNMQSGSISGASSVYLDGATLGSAGSNVNVTTDSNDIYVQGGSVVYGNLSAAVNANGTVQVSNGQVYGTCLPKSNPLNACNASPPPSVHHYELQYSGPGVTCEAEPVTIRACANQACSSYFNGAVSVSLTASGSANWSNSTPGFSNGSASSSVRLTSAGATTLGLSSASPAAANALVCKNGGAVVANCSLSFTDTALKIYASDGLAALPVLTAGQSYPGRLRAIQTDSNTGACQARVQGQRQVGVAFRCLNPGSCISGQGISLAGQTINGSHAGDALSYTLVALTFDANGSAPLLFSYSDVGQIALGAQLVLAASGAEPAITLTAPPAVTVVKPYRIRVSSVSGVTGSPLNPATSSSGSGFLAAGQPFRLVLAVENASGNRTPNFGRETTAAQLHVQFNQRVYPADGVANASSLLNTGSFTALSGSAGSFANNQLYYLQAGSFNLIGKLSNNDYLGAGNVTEQPVSATIGRFYPQAFVLSEATVGATCASANAAAGSHFSYLGQPGIPLSFVLQAVSAEPPGYQRVVLTDYHSGRYQQTAVVGLVAENDSAVYSGDLQSRLTGMPAVAWQSGEFRFSSGSQLQLGRRLAADNQTSLADGPFTVLQWGVRLSDALDQRNLSALNMHAGSRGVCPPSDCDAAALGSPQRFYYGRLQLASAYGNASAPLPLTLQAQVWDGVRFVSQQVDQCSLVDPALLNVSGTPTLTASGSAASLVNGQSPAGALVLAAPGQDGSWQLQYQAPAWLRYNWQPATPGDEAPAATAIFGRYRGNDRLIYWREQ